MTIQKIGKTKSDIESILTNDAGQVSIGDETLVPISALGIETGYIIDGCSITDGFTLTVNPGTVAIIDGVTGNPHIVDVPETGIGGLSDDPFDIFINYNDGQITFGANTSDESIPDNAFLIARHTSSDQLFDQCNLKESDGTISFPNENTIDIADSRGDLQVGTTVLDRETNTKYVITG